MANQGVFTQKLIVGMTVLFAVTAVLLLHAGSQRYELSKAAVTLKQHVNQLNRVIQQFQEHLNGPNGCTELVGHGRLVRNCCCTCLIFAPHGTTAVVS